MSDDSSRRSPITGPTYVHSILVRCVAREFDRAEERAPYYDVAKRRREISRGDTNARTTVTDKDSANSAPRWTDVKTDGRIRRTCCEALYECRDHARRSLRETRKRRLHRVHAVGTPPVHVRPFVSLCLSVST